MAIEEVIDVSVAGLGSVNDLAAGLERAAKAAADLDAALGKGMGSGAAGGADKLAASYEAAFAKIQEGIDKLNASMAEIGKAGAGGDAAAAGLGKITEAEKAAAEQADAMAASVGKADDAVKGLGGTSDATAGGLGKLSDAQKSVTETGTKLRDTSAGVSDGLKVQADQTAALTALQAEMADSQRALTALSAEHAAVMADSNSRIALGQRLNTAAYKDASDEAVASYKAQSAAAAQAAADAESSAKKHETLALGVAAAAGYGIYQAAQLQTQVTRLYTSAGESKANLPMIESGILGMAGPTATSQNELASGAYWVESAGFHGQTALNVLRSVAQGAYAEGAPLQDVANAATSILTSYGMYNPSQQQSNAVVNQMLTAVGSGKMTMAQLSTALPAVLPTAASAGLSLPQVLGSLATMTAPGMSAQWAAQNLRHTIGSLQNPNAVQTAEMYQLGLDPVKIAQTLGQTGIAGTMQEIQAAVKGHENKAGEVQLPAMNISKAAAQDALIMLKQMPPAIQGVAKAYLDGKISTAAWNAEMFKGSESAQAKALLQQFATVTNLAHGFNNALKAGQPDVQAYNAAVSKVLGGTVGMQTYLELTGTHSAVTAQNIRAVAAAAHDAGTNVQGWSEIQKTFNYQLKDFEYSAKAAATGVGAALLPEATTVMSGLAHVGTFLAGHPGLTKDLGIGGGILAGGYALSKVGSAGATVLRGAGTIAEKIGLHIPGLDNIGKTAGLDAAASGLSGAAGSLEGAAGSLEGAAASLRVGGVAGSAVAGEGAAAGAGAAEGAAAGEATAAGEVGGGAILGKAKPGALGALATLLIAKPVIDSLENQQNTHALGNTNPDSWFNSWPGLGHAVMHPLAVLGTSMAGTGTVAPPIAGSVASRYGGMPAPGVMSAPAAAPAPAPAARPADQLSFGGHPSVIKIPPPDTSALDAAKGKVQSDIIGLGGHPSPVRLPAPDTSAITAAKSKVTADLVGLTGHPAPVKLPSPDLSALAAAKGPATAAGAAVGQGFAAGIASETGAVVGAAAALAGAAAAAMNTRLVSHSPSEVTKKIGADFATGFEHGIKSHASAVKAASASIGSASVASLLQGLQGGQSNQQNVASAIYGALANPDAVTTIQQTIQQLLQDIPAGKDTGLVKWLNGQQGKLTALANKQGALMAQINNAQQVATSAIGGASITGAYGYEPALAASSGPTSAQALLTGMGLQAGDTKAFAAQLAQLQKMGLNATSLSQLAQAGTTAGLPIAEGLAQGGKGAITSLNAIEKQIIGASQKIGGIGGTAMYQAGLAVGQGLDTALKSALKQVGKDMAKEADEIIKTVQKDLGGKASKSSAGSSAAGTAAAGTIAASLAGGKAGTAAAEAASGLGKVGPAGGSAASGLDRVASAAGAAAGALGRIAALVSSPGSHAQPIGGGGYSAYSGGGGTTVHHTTVHVTVQGSVRSDTDLARVLQPIYLEQGDRNLGTGLQLRGRGA